MKLKGSLMCYMTFSKGQGKMEKSMTFPTLCKQKKKSSVTWVMIEGRGPNSQVISLKIQLHQ